MTADSGVLTLLDALVAAIERAGRFNPDDQVAPAAILWPDKTREWEPLLPLLRDRLPVVTLGEYDVAHHKGPAYWIRCVVSRAVDDPAVPAGRIPVVYLPGVSKLELRAVEDCAKELQPIAFLQYDGALFVHENGRDWTIRAFIETAAGGLNVSMGADSATKDAARRALLKLSEVPVSRLRAEAPLKAAFFDSLLNPDDARQLLAWINDPDGFQKRCDAEEWASFRSLCSTKYDLDPEKDGALTAARQLGEHGWEPWQLVWTRFTEAPAAYPAIPERLRASRPKIVADMFKPSDSWPQDNEAEEETLRLKLNAAAQSLKDEACALVRAAEYEHAQRREWVWSKLGASPMAVAVGHLSRVAEGVAQSLTGANTDEVIANYVDIAWKTDAAVLDALKAVDRPEDLAAIRGVIRAVYRPWLNEGVNEFQRAVGTGERATYKVDAPIEYPDGTCIVFVDGLRFDVAHRLADWLESRRYTCDLQWRLTALPSITATAKPAVSPVAGQLRGGPELTPSTLAGGDADIGALRKLMVQAGYQVLTQADLLGDPNGRAWTECGDIDNAGHSQGVALARQLEALLEEISHRVAELLDQGWPRVVVVTDHGWLLMPGGLPKVDLPEHLTVKRKGRCARLKPFSQTDHQQVPWYWDGNVSFAMSAGIACFEAGKEYEHGGLSPQECVTPVLTVTPSSQRSAVAIASITWRGLRCVVEITGAPDGASVDLRDAPANPATSIATVPRELDDVGKTSLLVPDDSRESSETTLVVLAPNGTLLAQETTKVGGD